MAMETFNIIKGRIYSSSDSDIVEFLAGSPSSNLSDLECLNKIYLADLKAGMKDLLTIKVVLEEVKTHVFLFIIFCGKLS